MSDRYTSVKQLEDNCEIVKDEQTGEELIGQQIDAFEFENAKQNLKQIRELDTEHLVKYHDVIEHKGQYYVLQECIVESLAKTSTQLTAKQVMSLCTQTLQGLEELHRNGLLHGNVCADAVKVVGIGNDIKVKLAGYCLSCERQVQRENQYFSPETLKTGQISQETDIWQAGILFYLLENQHFPFNCGDSEQLEQQVKTARPKFSARFPQGLGTATKAMLRYEPSERPTAEECLCLMGESGGHEGSQCTVRPESAEDLLLRENASEALHALRRREKQRIRRAQEIIRNERVAENRAKCRAVREEEARAKQLRERRNLPIIAARGKSSSGRRELSSQQPPAPRTGKNSLPLKEAILLRKREIVEQLKLDELNQAREQENQSIIENREKVSRVQQIKRESGERRAKLWRYEQQKRQQVLEEGEVEALQLEQYAATTIECLEQCRQQREELMRRINKNSESLAALQDSGSSALQQSIALSLNANSLKSERGVSSSSNIKKLL